MFHNVVLPTWLAKLFPLPTVSAGELSSNTISHINSRLDLGGHTDKTLLRPFQGTMPMGFKLSVFIAQTFVSSCLKQAVDIFRPSRFAPRAKRSLGSRRLGFWSKIKLHST